MERLTTLFLALAVVGVLPVVPVAAETLKCPKGSGDPFVVERWSATERDAISVGLRIVMRNTQGLKYRYVEGAVYFFGPFSDLMGGVEIAPEQRIQNPSVHLLAGDFSAIGRVAKVPKMAKEDVTVMSCVWRAVTNDGQRFEW